MIAQAVLGLALRDQYRDAAWIAVTWHANDWVTLLVAVPLLAWGIGPGSVESLERRLIAIGVAAYATYNYSFYLFGAALNVFFPLYVSGVLIGGVTVVTSLRAAGPLRAPRPLPRRGRMAAGGFLIAVGVILAVVWLALWARYAFAGRPTPVPPDAFRLVAALDLLVLIPALTAGGYLLWRGQERGFVMAVVGSVMGALYLLVLSTGTLLSIAAGSVSPPGELVIWLPLLTGMTTASCWLLRNATAVTA